MREIVITITTTTLCLRVLMREVVITITTTTLCLRVLMREVVITITTTTTRIHQMCVYSKLGISIRCVCIPSLEYPSDVCVFQAWNIHQITTTQLQLRELSTFNRTLQMQIKRYIMTIPRMDILNYHLLLIHYSCRYVEEL